MAAAGSPSTEPKLPCPSISGQAHGEILRHADQRVIDRRVAVRVILTHHVADDTGAFHISLLRHVAALVHREEDAPMHRLQPVAHIGKRARDDHAHGVIEIGFLHLLDDGDASFTSPPGGGPSGRV